MTIKGEPKINKNTTNIESAKLAHEIKNSLTLMRSTLNIVEKDNPGIKKHPYWSTLYEELSFICCIIDDYAALDSLVNLEYLPIDLGEIIEEVCEKFAPLLIENNITLKLTMPKDILHICGIEVKLQECFANIIKNAIESIEDGGGCVDISLELLGNQIKVTITDTGCGIAEEDFDDIFKPYTSSKKNGTGLGLNIIQGILAQHNGSYEVQSTLGKGTSFILYFPMAKL